VLGDGVELAGGMLVAAALGNRRRQVAAGSPLTRAARLRHEDDASEGTTNPPERLPLTMRGIVASARGVQVSS
jgi:hypothetical protein